MKILLVDDEKFIKLGLKKIIEEYNEKYVVCGMASDVTEAVEKVNTLYPDLVITDLCMYEEIGFDLLEYLNNNKPKIKHFIISGYENKEYLKRSIKLNTLEYLVKPIDKNELYKCLDRIYSIIVAERRNAEAENVQRHAMALLRKNLISIINNDEEFDIRSGFEWISENRNVEAMFDKYIMVSVVPVINRNSIEFDEENWKPKEYIVAIENIMMELMEENDYNVLSFVYKKQNLFMIDVLNKEVSVVLDTVNKIIDTISEIISKKIVIGVSEVNSGVEVLMVAIDKSINMIKEQLDELEYKVDDKNGEDKNDKKTFMEIRIDNVKSYIVQNYYKNISLNELAERFNISTQYLSNSFKKETGYTVVEYLMEIRINLAKEMLKEIDLKINEIAEMVGYDNPSYFTKIFKRTVGKTPEQYREEIFNKGNV